MPVTIEDINAAYLRIRPHIHRTPVMQSESLDELAGCKMFFKCENLQKAGAFKSRGAVNAVFSISDQQLSKGVATHSSGNHGAALARAASLRCIPAYIVVPENAKQVKKEAIRAYGAEIIECEATLQARESTLAQVVRDTGARVVHPYDDDLVIAGQGTAALEFLDQVSELDSLIVPVGGGGLLAGTAIVAYPATAVYGAEPETADDAYRSFQSGQRVKSHIPNTICDGLLTTVGERNFEIINEKVSDILLVSEEEIIDAMSLLWTRLKQVVEPSSAVTLAAVLRNRALFSGLRVGLVLTGGNVDP
jgi:threonine dehydratase